VGLLQEHRHWAELHADALLPLATIHENDPSPERRLRIGYVSADLREHSVSFFIEPILASHDRAEFYVVCYDNWPEDDKVNQRLRGLVDLWRKVHDLDDEQMAQLIRSDRVDILVDLSGHTVGNRLLAFARKPAPIQATWFGYMCTTGLEAIDYRITDAYLDPPGVTERYYVEELVRISSAAAFAPSPDSPAPGPLPSLTSNFVTFGSFNNYSKINDEAISVWSRILSSVPDSRLLLVVLGGDDPVMKRDVLQRFGSLGIMPHQMEVIGRRPLDKFLQLLQQVDIALDPFPYSGGTTSLHTLWMGVPIVALEGVSELSKSTSGMLRAAGADALVALSPEHYIDIAVRLATDRTALDGYRQTLRGRIARSPLLLGDQVTRSLEKAYRDMWRRWCVQKCAPAAPHAA
jgi:predicted O-linked N-acetylglucosamine transferase (SPINDLY family)